MVNLMLRKILNIKLLDAACLSGIIQLGERIKLVSGLDLRLKIIIRWLLYNISYAKKTLDENERFCIYKCME